MSHKEHGSCRQAAAGATNVHTSHRLKTTFIPPCAPAGVGGPGGGSDGAPHSHLIGPDPRVPRPPDGEKLQVHVNRVTSAHIPLGQKTDTCPLLPAREAGKCGPS